MRPPPKIESTSTEFAERWVNKFEAYRIIGSTCRETLYNYRKRGQIRMRKRNGEMLYEVGELMRAKAANVAKVKANRFQPGRVGKAGPGRGHKGPMKKAVRHDDSV